MAKRRDSALITAEMEVKRSEMVELSQIEGTDDEVEAAVTRSTELLDEIKELDDERVKAIDYEKRVEAVRAMALLPANRESGDGAAPARPAAPEVMRKVDPFADVDLRQVAQMPRGDVISRARAVVEQEKRVPITDDAKAHLDYLVQRAQEDGDEDQQFDGSYVAKRILLTENKFYRSAFKKYLRLGSMAQYNQDEQRAIAAFQDHELSRAASENTTTAGGFGVPVNLAA